MTTAAETPDLDRLAAAAWDAYLEANPVAATVYGDPRFDDRLPDPSLAGQAAAADRYAGLLAQAESLPPAGDPGEEVTRSGLVAELRGQHALVAAGLAGWNVDPLDGVPVNLLQVGDVQPAETAAQADRLLARWSAMPSFVDAHIAALRASLADGRVACVAPVDRVADVLAEQLARPDDASPLLGPVGRALAEEDATWSRADRERWAEAVREVVATGIRPAFERLHRVLVDEIRPAARPEVRPGLGHLPGGEAAYRSLVRVHTSLDVSPDELHRTGLAEIERIDAELAELAGRTIGARSLPEALASLRSDPALHFATEDEVQAKAESALARATEAIPAWFGRLPRTRCEVIRMGIHEAEHSTIAYYRPPAEDGSRPGAYFINTLHPETRPRYEAEVLAYHESIPGHHLQIAIGQELEGLPAFRRHLGPTAFFEGWGLYTERLSDEMGLYSGDLDRIGVLSFDAWRASRLVVDTGMHAMGWTRRQAIDFMLVHTALAENNVVNEVDRYIAIPGQALAYKTGQLELLRLRAEAQAALGPAFDIRAFHDVVLGNGAIPLVTLRSVVEAWIAQRAGAG